MTCNANQLTVFVSLVKLFEYDNIQSAEVRCIDIKLDIELTLR